MINVLKYKIYTLFHMVSFYVVMLVMTVWCLLAGADFDDEEGIENLFNYAKCFVLDSGFLSVFFAIFLAIFFVAEYKNGFIKSITTNMSKLQAVVSNFVIATIVYVIYTAYMVVVALVMGKFIVSDCYLGSINGLLSSVGIGYVVYIGFAAVLLAIAMLSRGTAWPIVLGMMICTQMTAIFTAAVNAIFDVSIAKYQISTYLFDFMGDKSAAITCGLTYFVIFGLLSLLIVKKKDV